MNTGAERRNYARQRTHLPAEIHSGLVLVLSPSPNQLTPSAVELMIVILIFAQDSLLCRREWKWRWIGLLFAVRGNIT
jgi:hypothetical protein